MLLTGVEYLLFDDDDLLVEYEGCLELLLLTVEFLFIAVGEVDLRTTVGDEDLLTVEEFLFTEASFALLLTVELYLLELLLFVLAVTLLVLATLDLLDVLLYLCESDLEEVEERRVLAMLLLFKVLAVLFLPYNELEPLRELLKANLFPNLLTP